MQIRLKVIFYIIVYNKNHLNFIKYGIKKLSPFITKQRNYFGKNLLILSVTTFTKQQNINFMCIFKRIYTTNTRLLFEMSQIYREHFKCLQENLHVWSTKLNRSVCI